MTKPNIDDTRFGETSGGVLDPGLSNPLSGKKDTGYLFADTPPAKEHSWLWNKAHQWFKYLNNLIDSSDNWSFPAGVAVGTVSGGNLQVTGDVLCQALDTSDTVTIGSNKNLILQGTGTIHHGPSTFTVPAVGFTVGPTGNTATLLSDCSAWILGTVTGVPTIVASLGLVTGDRVTTIVWEFDKVGSAAALTMALSSQNARTMTARDTLADVTSASGYVTVTRSAINYTLVANDAMVLLVTNANSGHRFSRATITYDHP